MDKELKIRLKEKVKEFTSEPIISYKLVFIHDFFKGYYVKTKTYTFAVLSTMKYVEAISPIGNIYDLIQAYYNLKMTYR